MSKNFSVIPVLEGMKSNIVLGTIQEFILVATASGGYQLYPKWVEVTQDRLKKYQEHYPDKKQALYWTVRETAEEESNWIHDLSEVVVSEISWDNPKFKVLIDLNTGLSWKDGNGSIHPVIVNAFDYLTEGKASYKVGAAVFGQLPTAEEVKNRWDCNVPLNRVKLF